MQRDDLQIGDFVDLDQVVADDLRALAILHPFGVGRPVTQGLKIKRASHHSPTLRTCPSCSRRVAMLKSTTAASVAIDTAPATTPASTTLAEVSRLPPVQ